MERHDPKLRRINPNSGSVQNGRMYIRRLQQQTNARLEDLEDASGITIQELSRLRTGSNKKPNFFSMCKLAMAVGVTPSEMARAFEVWDGDPRYDELYHLLEALELVKKNELLDAFIRQAKGAHAREDTTPDQLFR